MDARGITALAGTAVLMLTGILSTRDVLSSFANSGPLTVVCMFILSASLERTGLIGDLSKLFNKVAKGRELTALLVITLGAFMVSPFVNNTPVVVILMPIVLAFCRDHNIAASKLLIPLSYATILGAPAPWWAPPPTWSCWARCRNWAMKASRCSR